MLLNRNMIKEALENLPYFEYNSTYDKNSKVTSFSDEFGNKLIFKNNTLVDYEFVADKGCSNTEDLKYQETLKRLYLTIVNVFIHTLDDYPI